MKIFFSHWKHVTCIHTHNFSVLSRLLYLKPVFVNTISFIFPFLSRLLHLKPFFVKKISFMFLFLLRLLHLKPSFCKTNNLYFRHTRNCFLLFNVFLTNATTKPPTYECCCQLYELSNLLLTIVIFHTLKSFIHFSTSSSSFHFLLQSVYTKLYNITNNAPYRLLQPCLSTSNSSASRWQKLTLLYTSAP